MAPRRCGIFGVFSRAWPPLKPACWTPALPHSLPSMAELPGPNGAIPFTRDNWGYPAVKARDLREGTFALGYLHARDRLVQITLTGLAARGELMSVLGDVPIARLIDYGSRALGLGRDLQEQVAACSSESRALLEAYASGFNAGARARGYP